MAEVDTNDIINQLMNETFKDSQDCDSGELVHLDSHFEKRRNQLKISGESFLNDLIATDSCELSVMDYNNKTNCYQLNFNGLVIDFFACLRNAQVSRCPF